MFFAIPAVMAFLLTLLLTPVCRAASKRLGWVDQPNSRKLHRVAIPRAGGIAIFVGYALGAGAQHAWAILPAVFAAFATGLLDDAVNLKPRMKIAGQVIAALLACAAGLQIPGPRGWWHIPFTVLWLVGCTNAVNLIDGIDGLAAGVAFFFAAATFLGALLTGNAGLAAVAAPLLGALVGFLPYNFSPATIFMGDCGSNTIGFLLGCFAILWAKTNPTASGMTAPIIALAIPILDTALAIFRRFLRNEPIFAADCGHIHHRLLLRGFTPRRVACILYVAAAFFACLAILLTTSAYSRAPILTAFAIVIWLALRYLRYDEFDSVRHVCFGNALRCALTSDLTLRQLEGAINAAHSVDECWLALRDSGGKLGLSRANMVVFGRTFTAQFPNSGTTEACWSFRVPLDGAGVVDLEIPFGPTPASVARLANSLRTVLAAKLQTVCPKLTFAAAAGRRW